MSVVAEIKNIYEFSKETKNEEFKNFANHLLCFCESNKEQTNINDIESFSALIKKELNDGSKYDESLLYLIGTLEKQGFVECEKFYKNFQEHLQSNNEESQEQEDLKDELQSALLVNARLSDLKEQQEQLESLQENHKNSNNDDENFAENAQSNQFLESQEPKNTPQVSPQDMISYIKDEKSIMFPFRKQDTLESPAFLSAFYAHLNTKSNQELESLIAQVRAKNEALRAELKRLQEQNRENSQESLQKEIQDNANLSQELTQNTKANLAEAQTNVSHKQEANAQEQQPQKAQSQNVYAQMNAKLDEAERISAESDEKNKKRRQQYAIQRAKEKQVEKEIESNVAAFELALGLDDEDAKESQNKARKQK
ncbi:hypothetical protein [Helicobacter ganmani]|uniref:hypothetical protein n=1 Tax=Helicobacter ganmani TaxID=60246 RepID=UPI003A8A1050